MQNCVISAAVLVPRLPRPTTSMNDGRSRTVELSVISILQWPRIGDMKRRLRNSITPGAASGMPEFESEFECRHNPTVLGKSEL